MRHFRVVVLAFALAPLALRAQGLGWHEQAALNGNVFFGNTRQFLLGTAVNVERTDSTVLPRGEFRLIYGEDHAPVTDRRFVSKRSWIATASVDVRPFARVNPFAQGTLESSLEKKISRRYSAGGGARLNFVRTPRTEVLLSVGALAERTETLDPAAGNPATTLARGIGSFRYKRVLGTRVTFVSESSYQPALAHFDQYTVVSDNSVIFQLAKAISLSTAFRDSYDSQARSRGARTNNDGALLFGVVTKW